ncbi:MAG: hypothetical protein WC007_03635 [Pelobacteraceae bacterium]
MLYALDNVGRSTIAMVRAGWKSVNHLVAEKEERKPVPLQPGLYLLGERIFNYQTHLQKPEDDNRIET